MIYIFSTQALLDLLSGKPTITEWHKTAPARSVEVSVISIGQALRQIAGLASQNQRERLARALRRFEATLDAYDGVVPFDAEAARAWAQLMDADLRYTGRNIDGDEKDVALGVANRMVVATALARGGTIIENPQPYHDQVERLLVEHP